MSARHSDLLNALRARGVEVTHGGGDLRVRVRGVLSDADRTTIATHKAELLWALGAPFCPHHGYTPWPGCCGPRLLEVCVCVEEDHDPGCPCVGLPMGPAAQIPWRDGRAGARR